MNIETDDWNFLNVNYCLFKIKEAAEKNGVTSPWTSNLVKNLETMMEREPAKGSGEAIYCLNKLQEILSNLKKRNDEIDHGYTSNHLDDLLSQNIQDDNSFIIDLNIFASQLEILNLLKTFYSKLDIDTMSLKVYAGEKVYLIEKSARKDNKVNTSPSPMEFKELFTPPYDQDEKIEEMINRITHFFNDYVADGSTLAARAYSVLFDFLCKKQIIKAVTKEKRTEKLKVFYAGFGKKIADVDGADVFTVTRNITNIVKNSALVPKFEQVLRGWIK